MNWPLPVIANYVDGKEIITLTHEEMIPPLGLAKKVIRLVPQVGNSKYCEHKGVYQ